MCVVAIIKQETKVNIDTQTILTICTIIGGAFISMLQHTFSNQMKAFEVEIERMDAFNNQKFNQMIKDIEDVEISLQHTRENYVTNDRFESRMNDLSKQMENMLTKMDRYLYSIDGNLPVRKA